MRLAIAPFSRRIRLANRDGHLPLIIVSKGVPIPCDSLMVSLAIARSSTGQKLLVRLVQD